MSIEPTIFSSDASTDRSNPHHCLNLRRFETDCILIEACPSRWLTASTGTIMTRFWWNDGYCTTKNLSVTVLRLPMVYGPGAHEVVKRRFFTYLKRMTDGRPAILLDERTANWRAASRHAGECVGAG